MSNKFSQSDYDTNRKKLHFECCSRCGGKTHYFISDSVVRRYYYVHGAGQLCEECWNKIYGKGGDEAFEAKESQR